MATSLRVLHAPINIANQMTALTRGLRAIGVDATACEFERTWLGYPVDRCLHLEEAPTRVHRWVRQLRFLLWALPRFDVFHLHFGESLLPHNRDLFALRRRGKRVLMHYWGSDVRPRSRSVLGRTEPRRARRLRRVATDVRTALVGDAELASYVQPFFAEVATVRQAIELDAYAPAPPREETTVPLVVHAPSRAMLKGTPAVLAAVEQLRQRHRFEFQLVENTPHQQALETYRRADVIVDQLTIGTHGLFAVEAMALAKPTICYLDPQWRGGYPAELPLVSATEQTIADVLAELLGDARRRRQLGDAGRAYVERHHDARVVARGLLELYTRGQE